MNLEAEFEWLPAVSGTGFAKTAAPSPLATRPPFVVLDGFAFDDATMPMRHVAIVERIARLVVASRVSPGPIETVTLAGNADRTGTVGYNKDLAKRRADAVGRDHVGSGAEREHVSLIPRTECEAQRHCRYQV